MIKNLEMIKKKICYNKYILAKQDSLSEETAKSHWGLPTRMVFTFSPEEVLF